MRAASVAERVRFHGRYSFRIRSVLPREFQGQSCSSCASGVDQFAVRAAYTLTKSQGVFLTRRDAARQRGASERPKHDSAAVLDPRGAEI